MSQISEEAEKVLKNLCDTCLYTFAECDGEPVFGNGKGNDNVVECSKYRG